MSNDCGQGCPGHGSSKQPASSVARDGSIASQGGTIVFWRRIATSFVVVMPVLVAIYLAGGCGRVAKGVKQAREGARVAQELEEKGEVTVKDEEGESVTVKAGEEDEGKGSMSIEGDEAKIKVDVHEEEGGASWTITNQRGETSTGAVTKDVTEADVGLKFYPGAEVEQGSKGSTAAGEGASWTMVSLTTKDPVGKVADFYKKAYPDAANVIEMGGGVHIIVEGSGAEGKTITVTPDEDEGVTRIILNAGSG